MDIFLALLRTLVFVVATVVAARGGPQTKV